MSGLPPCCFREKMRHRVFMYLDTDARIDSYTMMARQFLLCQWSNQAREGWRDCAGRGVLGAVDCCAVWVCVCLCVCVWVGGWVGQGSGG